MLDPIIDLVPHSGKMAILDHLISADDHQATSTVSIHSGSMFFIRGKGVPVWIGIEYMAQTIAALSGYHAKLKGEAVKIGLLVGCRKSICHVPHFGEGWNLNVQVTHVWEAEGMAVFDCVISADDNILMEANINVYQPENIEAYLRGARI